MADPLSQQDVDRILKGIDREVLEVTAQVAGAVIDDLVVRSPVRTGAYRASHAILGGEANILIFEGPERPGGDEIIPVGSRAILEPPEGHAAAQAVRDQAEPGGRLEIWNGRFYASLLEYGTPSMAPRTIYGAAEAVGEASAQSIIQQRDRQVIE